MPTKWMHDDITGYPTHAWYGVHGYIRLNWNKFSCRWPRGLCPTSGLIAVAVEQPGPILHCIQSNFGQFAKHVQRTNELRRAWDWSVCLHHCLCNAHSNACSNQDCCLQTTLKLYRVWTLPENVVGTERYIDGNIDGNPSMGEFEHGRRQRTADVSNHWDILSVFAKLHAIPQFWMLLLA